ncbi:MAG: 4-aminobutyrate transaminase [Ilumatobacteraceae bacterium]|nr:4-aminobutyrate transaminase [Ilumatobacteraceae bacterium]
MDAIDDALDDPFDDALVRQLLAEHYGVADALRALPGEVDRNVRVSFVDGREAVLRIHHHAADRDELDLQASVLEHLADTPGFQRIVPSTAGDVLPIVTDAAGDERVVRLTTWLDGAVWADAIGGDRQRRATASASLGRLLGELDRRLADFHHPAAKRHHRWDLALAAEHLADTALITDQAKRAAVESTLTRFREDVAPRLADAPRQVIHNDANDRNILVAPSGEVTGLIDFGDTVDTWRINEVAIACAYTIIAATDPIAAAVPLVAAYHDANPLTETEVDTLFDLIRTRYAVSITVADRQIAADPGNDYLLISQADVWTMLQRLDAENPRVATMRLRAACRFEPVPQRAHIEHWLRGSGHRFVPVLPRDLSPAALTVIDFSGDTDEGRRLDAMFTDDDLATTVPVGRYGEDRSVYRTEAFETADPDERRTIHIGIDLFAPAGEEVVAPFDAVVHEVGYEAVPLGFGGILVLEHRTDPVDGGDGTPFWTLYGHLSSASMQALRPGQRIAAGETVARLGRPDENGGWPPHLHFQLMTDLCGWSAEQIIGVVARSQWDTWRAVFPNPNLVLGLAVDCSVTVARDAAWLQRERQHVLGRSLSLAYAEPLKIVRGAGVHLIDEHGRRYLDMVNNVCHVGHCHPRVVAAGQRQMAVLNTNTRYLHDTIVEYTRRLTDTLPPASTTGEGWVLFMVNSGSEANDLALRMARTYTGNHDVLTVDHVYHGNLTSIVDISPYKFAGPGGTGRRDHVWVAEMPDTYRGRLRGNEPEIGPAYAVSVAEQIEAMSSVGRAPAAFFSEGILGTGGMLTLPDGYLAAAYEHVRAAGGVCVADEVQLGFGRVGTHMWAFETQGVVPDIVTMGKPIGNGHPIGAVAVRAPIADAFANGMEYFSTFGGNPVSATIALAVLDVIRDERLMHNADVVGTHMMAGLRALAERHSIIGDVRGHGLFIGVELVRDRTTLEPAAAELGHVIEAMKARRILLSTEGPHHNVLKIKPPIVFSAANCDEFLSALDQVLGELPVTSPAQR